MKDQSNARGTDTGIKGPLKFDVQAAGRELDKAIGLLNTQLKALPTVGLSGKVILH